MCPQEDPFPGDYKPLPAKVRKRSRAFKTLEPVSGLAFRQIYVRGEICVIARPDPGAMTPVLLKGHVRHSAKTVSDT